jgi:O-acetyl-ADP-ribose deacetylase (regulator of RNase III)
VDPEADDGVDGSTKPPLEPRTESPFPFSETINRKIVFWKGDLCALVIDAIVNTTNERLTEKTGICGRVFQLAGPKLAQECVAAESCPTGDAIITSGCELDARHIIHTVGPRFSLKYKTAAENALHGCYRRSLEVLKDNGLKHIAFPVVNTDRKGYPRRPAAHIALRTVRRFLDMYGGGIETVIFAIPPTEEEHYTIYSDLLPLYFPRNAEEQKAVLELIPADIGNEIGETVIEDRKIRVGGLIAPEGAPSGTQFQMPPKPLKDPVPTEQRALMQASFSQMSDHPDDMREKRDDAKPKGERELEENNRRYNKILRQAMDTDLSDMAELNFIYESGQDNTGRPNIVFVASHIPVTTINMDRVLMYMVRVLDPVVDKDFNVIYFHSNFSSNNKPSFAWLKEVYSIFNRKYKKNMKRIFLVHPTFWTKMVLLFAKPFVSAKVWKKLFYIPKLRDIYEFFDGKILRIPEEIIKYDQDMFGAQYARDALVGPSTPSSNVETKNDGL